MENKDNDKGIRPVKDFAKSYCFTCFDDTMFQLNSNKEDSKSEYECQICGHKTNMLVRS
jgi:DNA-directed RNA polymerase subunit RPC12/RpoP